MTSPGRGRPPPPTRPCAEIVWCGALKGRSRMRAPEPRPAALCIWVISSASSRPGAGRMPGRRRASIVLPTPGGPTMSRLCPPAAAISSARFASSWPRTSRRSSSPERSSSGTPGSTTCSGSPSPLRRTAISWRSPAPITRRPSTRVASDAFWCGTSMRSHPASLAPMAAARVPRTPRSSPLSDSSPHTAVLTSASQGTWPLAASSPTAMARSKPGSRLPHVRGREIHRQALHREVEPGVLYGRAHPLA